MEANEELAGAPHLSENAARQADEQQIFQGELVRSDSAAAGGPGSSSHPTDGASPQTASASPSGSRLQLRFGIGGVMILVTVLALQYALVKYLGPIAAMAIPPLICSALVVVVVAAELRAWRHPQGRAQSLGRRTFTWSIGYVFLLGLSAALAGGGQVGYEWYVQWRLERRIQRDLGFTSAPGLVWETNQRQRRAVYLLLVEPGGPFDQAGASNGQAVVSDLPPADWFRMLDENRGRAVNVVVASNAATNPLEKCPQRTITVAVPR